ncbi:MAG: anhydro-N-acetylmuramic acid kinase, partial [Flavobacteriales bacterium]
MRGSVRSNACKTAANLDYLAKWAYLSRPMHTFHCIGLMSGTSLDGVDLVFCRLNESKGQWKYTLLKATTIPYSTEWEDRLRELADDHGMSLLATNLAYGHYLGKLVGEFASDLSPVPDFVSSHGHTVFHQPHLGYTLQIGYGPAISAACGLPVVCNFRTQDVVLGGQGAPLVPVGDRLLFG